MDAPRFEALSAAVGELNEMKALTAALDLAESDASGYAIYEALVEGIRRVDRRYEAGNISSRTS